VVGGRPTHQGEGEDITVTPRGSAFVRSFGLFWRRKGINWSPGHGDGRNSRLLGRRGLRLPIELHDRCIDWFFDCGTRLRAAVATCKAVLG
jgi:hypothetical protein